MGEGNFGMISAREAYKNELVLLAAINPKILCLEADLAGHNSVFKEKFPERFFNIGIAEHTLLGMAAGLSKAGFIPFVNTFAPFAIFRAAEMIKLSMSYMHLNIKLVCPYGGVSGGWFGPTHHCLEDLGVLQTLPGICLGVPHGEHETRAMLRWASTHVGPVYIRLGRNAVFSELSYLDLLQYPYPRRTNSWSEQASILLLSVGEIGTELIRQYLQNITTKPLNFAHLHAPFVDAKALAEISLFLQRFTKTIVVEEVRAFGSIASSLAVLNPTRQVISLTVNNSWPHFGGTQEEILTKMEFSCAKLKSLVEVN